jgi:hypothetical protein
MLSFTELLTASDSELVKIFYKFSVDEKDDFIIKINKAAALIGLNHSQLVCALGFNKHIRNLVDIYSTLGFRSYKLLAYRCNELFSTDTYNQLPIDNILDIYSERLEDQQILDTIKDMINPRLEHIEAYIDKHDDPSHIFSYRMEIHAIYSAGIVDQGFAEKRLKLKNGKFRILSDEVNAIIQAGVFPPSNLFFTNDIIPEEKKLLIENKHITPDMIKNRLQNKNISKEERELLETYI